MHMKNPAQTGSGCIRFNDIKVEINLDRTGSGCIRFNDIKEENATFAEYSCPIRLRR
jgi:hypothetical protein